ncbi:MAG TPA: hypothetical protein VFU37_14730 [Pyrinomonadaceae bacterium]|nr:hypothetical protein [Pyrinomonadaceae bacterium]
MLNYFSYFSEIEDTFVRRRGKHLMLSPIDWALIESWKERGVPLHVALRGIEHAFDSHDAKKHKRTVKTLLYCQEEVEAQYAEWLESRVGKQNEQQADVDDDVKSTFSRDVVLKFLYQSHAELTRLYEQRRVNDDLTEIIARAAALLAEIKDDYATSPAPSARKLEDSLTGIERLLSDALRSTLSQDEMAGMRSDIAAQLKPYRRHMEKDVYELTLNNLLLKRLREKFGVPRLSLFHL